MKTDPERSDYIGTSDAFAFECCLNGLARIRSRTRSKGGNGSSGFSRTSFVFSFCSLSLFLSLCVIPFY